MHFSQNILLFLLAAPLPALSVVTVRPLIGTPGSPTGCSAGSGALYKPFNVTKTCTDAPGAGLTVFNITFSDLKETLQSYADTRCREPVEKFSGEDFGAGGCIAVPNELRAFKVT
ncbi:MAG: hypothetical protein Q9191_002328 [Dirinaria sp. TL-2023a]